MSSGDSEVTSGLSPSADTSVISAPSGTPDADAARKPSPAPLALIGRGDDVKTGPESAPEVDQNSGDAIVTKLGKLVQQSGVSMTSPRRQDGGFPERKRRASNDSVDSSTKASECAAEDMSKDDDDDNDDDEEEKPVADPERLKAFNMFVRLFVDENLDRVVPISKQPKDKIQAILEASNRQFPDFRDRSRKRIRTYLKSCRRMRRSKDVNGWEPLRPTPPHLTSAAAEGMLAQACDNESNNAKRMRLGLEPLSSTFVPPVSTVTVTSSVGQSPPPAQTTRVIPPVSQPPPPQPTERPPAAVIGGEFIRHIPAAPTAFRPPPPQQQQQQHHDVTPATLPPFFPNGNGLFRTGYPVLYPQAHTNPPVIQRSPLVNQLQNGPTDLSIKKSPSPNGSAKSQLNPNEVATIKQLIAGYRESAAFLYRSADELEQLLMQQN